MASPGIRGRIIGFGVFKLLLNYLANLAAHLSGGAIRERDGDDLADFRLVVAQVREVALGEDGGFAAAGARRQDDGDVARDDGAALLLGERIGEQGRRSFRRHGHDPIGRKRRILRKKRAEREGFEPSVRFPTPVFETGPIGHSGTSPANRAAARYGILAAAPPSNKAPVVSWQRAVKEQYRAAGPFGRG